MREKYGPLSLTAVFQQVEPAAIVEARLLPPFQDHPAIDPGFSCPPLLNLDATEFLVKLVDHYLLAALPKALYASLMAENRRRMQHLEGAIRHLDERVEYLRRKGRQLRQEEIIEEIEVILLGATLNASSGNRQDMTAGPDASDRSAPSYSGLAGIRPPPGVDPAADTLRHGSRDGIEPSD